MFEGPRYARQQTHGSAFPYYYATKEYVDYVHSLPPGDQVDAISSLISTLNNKRQSYYRKHFPFNKGTISDYSLSHFSSGYKQAYNTQTHRPKYYY